MREGVEIVISEPERLISPRVARVADKPPEYKNFCDFKMYGFGGCGEISQL